MFYLVSYPKSGNTWTRFLIANLIYPDSIPISRTSTSLFPIPEGVTKRHLEELPRPRYLKSHAYFDHRYPKVIHIVRDPRDVVLSEYYFDIKRSAIPDDFPLEKFVSRFVSGELNHPYGTWGENTATWFYARGHSPRLLLVTYEALQSDGARQMARIAEFIGAPANQSASASRSSKARPTACVSLKRSRDTCGPRRSARARTSHLSAPPKPAVGKTNSRKPASPRSNRRGAG